MRDCRMLLVHVKQATLDIFDAVEVGYGLAVVAFFQLTSDGLSPHLDGAIQFRPDAGKGAENHIARIAPQVDAPPNRGELQR